MNLKEIISSFNNKLFGCDNKCEECDELLSDCECDDNDCNKKNEKKSDCCDSKKCGK